MSRRSGSLSFGFLIALLLVPVSNVAAEQWADNTGKFQIEAKFVSFDGETLKLEKANGKTIVVPKRRLSPASLEMAIKMAGGPVAAKQTTRKRASSTSAGNQTAQAASEAFLKAAQANDMAAIWEMMPGSYQADMNEAVNLFGSNMDPGLWNSGLDVFRKTVKVMQTKQEFLKNSTALEGVPVEQVTADKNLDTSLEAIATVLSSDYTTLDKLKSMDIGQFLKKDGAILAEKMAELAEQAQQQMPAGPQAAGVDLKAYADAKVNVIEESGDKALVRAELADGKTEDMELVRIEGQWIPADIANQWDENMTKTKSQLEALPAMLKQNKMMALGIIVPLTGVADQLLAAKSQEEFDGVINQLIQTFGPMLGPMITGGAGGEPQGFADPEVQEVNFEDADFGGPPAEQPTDELSEEPADAAFGE